MPKAKVCILTTGHCALDGRIFYKEARSLQQAGYEVTLLAPLNDEGFLFDAGKNKIATGETTLYDIRIIGFSWEKRGIFINRVILKLSRLASLIGLRIGTELFAELAELIDKGTNLRANVYHCHEIFSLYAGIQIKRRLEKEGRKPKLIYDVHEYTPATSPTKARGINKLYDKLSKKVIVHFEKEALKYVDYTITVSEVIRDYLLTQNRSIQTEVVYNCSVFPISQEQESVKPQGKVIICHEGSLSFNRGLKRMIEVMRVLKEGYGNRVGLLIIGTVLGEERRYLDQKLDEYDLQDTIRCTGWLTYEKVSQAIYQADIGIMFSEPTENIMLGGGLGNKLFNYMRCGLPIVSVKVPERSRVISETQCGLVVTEPSTESLAKALSVLIDDEAKRRQLGDNARKAGYNQYGWEQMETRLLRVYQQLLYP